MKLDLQILKVTEVILDEYNVQVYFDFTPNFT